eukprot:XP_001703444.1 predicted protein [Chlamydomonas reinhardtii]
MTPEVSAAVGASPAAGPQQRAQQPAPNLPGVPEALADKENVVRPNEVALLQRLAQAEASREQLLAQLAARDRELAAARKLAQQPAPQAAPQAGRSMRDATHIAEITAALAAANHGLCSVTKAAELQLHAATTEARRAQASLATALEANMANLEATLAVKRDAMARVERVMAEADEKLRMQAMLAREREHMLLLEAGRLQQVAAQWEARARSLEARMAGSATSDGGRSCSGSGGAGGNSTDTTPFSPSQVLADVSSAEAARKRARAAAACVAAVTAAPPPDHEDASGAGGVEEPAGAHMGLGAAEEVMRRLYLGVLASARAVPQAAAAFETRAELEQLPGFAQCVAAQDIMFFSRIEARIGGRKAGFSRTSPLRYASPDALRADFARILDNCHAYNSHCSSGGGSPVKAAAKALLGLAVAVLVAADAELEAVRGSEDLAHALAAVEAMEHKLECRECGNWRRVRGYGPFVRVRCDFICSKLPGRTCQQPCDVCGAAGGCECLD